MFTIAELPAPAEGQSFSAEHVLNHRAQEMAAILTKMNLDNDRITDDFDCIGDDYMRGALPYDRDTRALLNLSHDDRLFFSFCRRGALAVTANMDRIPGYFVLPSFVNLLEILRARWHLGNIVNLELDEAIETLVSTDGVKTAEALNTVYRARMILAMFLRDPVPYLFDGGAITEVAQMAETEFWLSRMRSAAEDKLDTLDNIIQHRRFSEAYASVEGAKERLGKSEKVTEEGSDKGDKFLTYLAEFNQEDADENSQE